MGLLLLLLQVQPENICVGEGMSVGTDSDTWDGVLGCGQVLLAEWGSNVGSVAVWFLGEWGGSVDRSGGDHCRVSGEWM